MFRFQRALGVLACQRKTGFGMARLVSHGSRGVLNQRGGRAEAHELQSESSKCRNRGVFHERASRPCLGKARLECSIQVGFLWSSVTIGLIVSLCYLGETH